MFSLGRVQFSLSSPLFSLACSSNILLLCLNGSPRPSTNATTGGQPPQLVRIDLDKPTEVNNIDLPIPPPSMTRQGPVSTLHAVHLDPTGRHVIVSTSTGENYYVYIGPAPPNTTTQHICKPRPLSRIKGALIDSVAWATSSSSHSLSTREILLGTATGQILETTLIDPALAESSSFSLPVPGRAPTPERYVKLLHTLSERQAISGLRYEVWGKRAAIIVTTKTRIYQFVGTLNGTRKEEEGSALEPVFQLYGVGDVQPKSLELPGEPINSELHFFSDPKMDQKGYLSSLSPPLTLAWLTGPGVYHGNLAFPTGSSDKLQPGDGIVESASLIPYPAEPVSPTHAAAFDRHDNEDDDVGRTEMPISMLLTKWHIILLYEDRIRVIGLLSDKVVYEEALELDPGVHPMRLAIDPVKKTCWMYTSQAIFELVVKDEDRDIWKHFLSSSNWDQARRYAKTPKQRDTVLAAEADAFFANGRYIQSAQGYAQSSKSFEEVVLRFVDKGERDALRYYLVAKLERLKRTDVTQRTMLATWLVEIYLSKISQLEDIAAAERASEDVENFKVEQGLIEDEMRQFMNTYKDNLDHKTVFDLLERHGRDEMILYFASIVGQNERIVTHWIMEENWAKALEALNKQEEDGLYYRFAAVLLRNAPKDTIDSLMRRPSLDVRRLIPALSAPQRNASDSSRSTTSAHAIRYLQHAILQLDNTHASVHNTLLTLFATQASEDEADFLRFLATSPDNPLTGDPYYDLDYALRLCRAHKRVQACVLIYSKMGLYESSVDLALEHDDLELAKINADKPEHDDLLRKKLWLKIARYVVGQKNDIKLAMRFLESTDLLKIEDILPFFPDFVVVDDFKDEICNALEDYSAHIERLKSEMDEATRSAEAIKSDIADLRNRFVVVDASEKCGSCRMQLLTRQFYVFPCQHAFHADCLITEVTKHLSPVNLRRMLDLQAQLAPAAPTRARRNLVEDTQAQTLKLAAASVQGLDQLRKLVLPDALLGIIGGAVPVGKLMGRRGGSGVGFGIGMGGSNGATLGSTVPNSSTTLSASAKKEAGEKQGLREALDELLASSCVLCEGAIGSVDKGFVDDGEEM